MNLAILSADVASSWQASHAQPGCDRSRYFQQRVMLDWLMPGDQHRDTRQSWFCCIKALSHVNNPHEESQMKVRVLFPALALAASNALAADAPPEFPKTPEEVARLATDFTRNAEMLKDPKKFVPFVAVSTDPAFLFALSNQMMEPGRVAEMFNSLMNPASYSAWMPLATDPEVYMRWAAASMDGNFYTALVSQLNDPAKLMRWAMVPTDPRALELLMKTLNPQNYLKWVLAPTDPRVLQTTMAPMNPALYSGWMGAGMNPASYGNTWQGLAGYPYAFPTPNVMPMPAPVPMQAPAWPTMVPYGMVPQPAPR